MSKNPVKIYKDTWVDVAASDREGREIWREDTILEVFLPGGNSTASRLKNLTDADRRLYADEIARFNSGEEEKLEGTPLDKMPDLKKSMVKELEFFNIKTVEQLALAPDHVMQKFMGGNGIRDKAKDFVSKMKDNAFSDKFSAENEALKKQLEELRNLVEGKTVPSNEQQEEPKKKKLGIF